jgi:nanoRNase/pAp phosphatase (c-di-AMP/oligoRNAs hydrolase)
MGYNIELSFNALKQNISETYDFIVTIAVENGCNYYYNDFEFENNVRYKRNHCVITVSFQNYDNNIDSIIKFLKIIRNIKGIHIESIYDDNANNFLFASTFYLTQMMDKHIAKTYKLNKRQRS